MAVLLFCQCGSDRIELGQWNGIRVRIKCATCGREAWLDGFTVSDFEPSKLFAASLVDQARKHRRRSPEELRRVAETRKRA